MKTKFDKVVREYFEGQISRNQFAEISKLLSAESVNIDIEIETLNKLISVWSVKQSESEFITTRTELLKYYRSLPENNEEKLDEKIKEYLENNFYPMDKASEDDIRELFKKSLELYFEDEISEIFLHTVVTELMFKPPYFGYNFKDKVLQTILDRVADWNIFWSDNNEYIEKDLLEYLEKGTGVKTLDSKEYFEKYLKDKK